MHIPHVALLLTWTTVTISELFQVDDVALVSADGLSLSAPLSIVSALPSDGPLMLCMTVYIESGFAASTAVGDPGYSTIEWPSPSVAPQDTSSVSLAISSISPPSSSSLSTAVPAPATASAAKRGLAYQDASLTRLFAGYRHLSWAYNWNSGGGVGLPRDIHYVPMLFSADAYYTTKWHADVQTALSQRAQYLFSFNEPDLAGFTAETAALEYIQWIQPYAGVAKLGAPAVTNGGDYGGLNWLSHFLKACNECRIDFVNIHWYAELGNPLFDAVDNFKSHARNATRISGKPLFVTEFGPSNGAGLSDEVVIEFLQAVMPWMDQQDFVLGYAYFEVANGSLISNSRLSPYGQTYATYPKH